jgi:hypothetical protein
MTSIPRSIVGFAGCSSCGSSPGQLEERINMILTGALLLVTLNVNRSIGFCRHEKAISSADCNTLAQRLFIVVYGVSRIYASTLINVSSLSDRFRLLLTIFLVFNRNILNSRVTVEQVKR